jgi:hypothetical protein
MRRACGATLAGTLVGIARAVALLCLSSIEKEDNEGERMPNIITLHSELFSL